ncbi:hypothetical protein L7P61_20150, partial [Aeromonas veronii bv. sobria]
MKNIFLSFIGIRGWDMEKLDKSYFDKEKEFIWQRLSELTQELNGKANSEELKALEMSVPESLKDAAQS